MFCNEQILARKVVTDQCICWLLLDSDASKFFDRLTIIVETRDSGKCEIRKQEIKRAEQYTTIVNYEVSS